MPISLYPMEENTLIMKISLRAAGVSPSLTLAITAKAKKLKSEGLPVVSFGAGEPDFNTPDFIVEAAKEALDKGFTKYTAASGMPELKAAVCEKLKRDNGLEYEPNQIVISNGAKHSLSNIMQALIEEGDEVIIPAPYWLTYPELVRINGGKPVIIHTDPSHSFKLTPSELKAAITDKTKAIIINNPNNPTGAVYSKSEIYALAEVLQNTDIVVISDEIYENLSYGEEVVSIATYSPELRERTVVVNGVAKSYAMTGWRIGYTASCPELAKAMGNMQSHETSNPNSIAQYATITALSSKKSEEFLDLMRTTFDRRRLIMIDELKKVNGIEPIVPKGAFYVMFGIEGLYGKSYDGEKISSAMDFARILLDKYYVAVIPCESFGADGYIRLSYSTSENDIRVGIDRIREFVSRLK